ISAGASVAIICLVLCGLFVAAQDQKKRRRTQGRRHQEDQHHDRRAQIPRGLQGRQKHLHQKSWPQERKKHVLITSSTIPQSWAQFQPFSRRSGLRRIGDRVELQWVATGHGPAITAFKVFATKKPPSRNPGLRSHVATGSSPGGTGGGYNAGRPQALLA